MRCQHASVLLHWDQAAEWFQRELGGYPAEAERPNYRIVIGKMIWQAQTNSMNDRINRVAQDFYGLAPDPEAEPTELYAWYDIDVLIKYAQTGAQHATGETKAGSGRHQGRLLERVKVFDASGFQSVLNAIQRITFKFASGSYASLLNDTGQTASGQSTDDAQTAPNPNVPGPVTIQIGTMTDSQLQVAGGDQTGSIGAIDHGALLDIIHELINVLPDLGLNDAVLQEAKADADTVQSQLGSSRPKSSVIHESLTTLRRILEGAVGSTAATGFA